VVALWSGVFIGGYEAPHNHPEVSIDLKTAYDPDLFLVAVDGDCLVGTVMGGYDGHRGWIYSLAVDENERHRGIGTELMAEVERRLKERGCLKVNLQVMPDNEGVVQFYRELGFSVEDRLSMGKRLYDGSLE
jgi:ribosomal protein S18 acetylase RimI-like enzyme